MTEQPSRALRAGLWSSLAVWAALMLLLAASLVVAYQPLGGANLPFNIGLAIAQAGLIAAFFMRLRGAAALLLLTASAALLFLAVMFALTFNDLFSRI